MIEYPNRRGKSIKKPVLLTMTPFFRILKVKISLTERKFIMVRFAVIGTNFITDYVLGAAQSCPDFKLMAVHSRREERAREYAEQWGAPLWFTDLESVAACPEVDAVYIATPNYSHKEYAIQMMRAGKHVLVEKSGAANAREWEQMMEVAKENNVVLLEAVRTAFNPNYARIREALPKLGTLRRAILSSCSYSRRYDNFKQGIIENAFVPELANGALMDLGVYTMNFMTGLFGMPQDITAAAIKLHNGLDGVGMITASYETMLVTMFYGKVAPSANHCEIQGEEGYMTIQGMSAPMKVSITYRDGTTEELPLEDIPFRKDLAYEVQAFIEMIQKADGSEAPFNARSLTSFKVMDRAREIMGMHFPNDDIV